MSAQKVERTNTQVVIEGKLIKVDRFDGNNGPIFENLIVIPAPDEYKSPTRFVVKSGHQLAQIDQKLNVLCDLRSRYWKSKKDGRQNYSPELWIAE